MVQKVHKFGNSLAVVIPASKDRAHRLRAGALVEVVEIPGGWQVRPVTVVPSLPSDLQEMADELAKERAEVFKALAE